MTMIEIKDICGHLDQFACRAVVDEIGMVVSITTVSLMSALILTLLVLRFLLNR